MFARPPLFAGARFAALVAVLATIGAMTCFIERSVADVVTVGVVSPIPPVNGGTFSSQLIVGNGTNEQSNDIWGWVSLDDGTVLQYGSLILGDNEGYFGEVNVLGNFLGGQITQFNLSGIGSTNDPTVQIGNEGTGYFNIGGGARMTLTNQNADLAIGLESTGVGYLTASDQFTMLTSPETLVVGQSGVGHLNVLNGALVRTLSNSRSNYISIGRNISGVGSAVVDGQGSLLQTGSTLRVGESGIGSLTISNGGLVQATLASTPITPPPFPAMVSIGLNATGAGTIIVEGTNSRLQTRRDLVVGGLGQGTLKIRDGGAVQITDKAAASAVVGPLGRIELDGGTFDGSTPLVGFGTSVAGYVGGSGEVRGTMGFTPTSTLEASPGDRLRFHNDVDNQGAITINAGEIQFNTNFTNNAAGRISLENGGTIRFGQTLTNNGVLSNAHGVTNIHGAINNPGTIVVARDTVATFHNTVVDTGTITVLPGGNALFLGDLMFQSMALLSLGVDDAELNDGSARVASNGVVTLGGTLEISLPSGFDPFVGQSLELISAGGGIVGAFDEIRLPLVPNDVDVNLVYGPNGVAMQVNSISVGVPGDYNDDGIVDAADYSVWRDHLGSATALPNDDTPGVGDDDYARWRAHFGQVANGGAGSIGPPPTAAPEPSSLLLLVAAASILSILRRR